MALRWLAFEREYQRFSGAKHAVATISGTVGIELVLRALEIGRGDEVILPPYSFAATLSAIAYVGATPVFADIDSTTLSIDPDAVEAAITPRTKAVVCVHIGGYPCDMERLGALADRHQIALIEDAAQAHGARFEGRHVGTFGTAGVLSLQNSKNLTCGEGGVVLTNDDTVYDAVRRFNEKGIGGDRSLYWSLGMNWTMNEFCGALLLAQMEKLESETRLRNENATRLAARLSRLDFITPIHDIDPRVTCNGLHIFMARYYEHKAKGISRSLFLSALQAEGIDAFIVGYNIPLYRFKILSSQEFLRHTGSQIDYSQILLPQCEKAMQKEVIWCMQPVLLAESSKMDLIAEGFEKISSNLDELCKVEC